MAWQGSDDERRSSWLSDDVGAALRTGFDRAEDEPLSREITALMVQLSHDELRSAARFRQQPSTWKRALKCLGGKSV